MRYCPVPVAHPRHDFTRCCTELRDWLCDSYYISRRAGSRALKRFSPAKQKKVKNWIDRHDVLSVLVASVMPPPFPFKLFVVSAGVFRFSLMRFIFAVIAGRLFRFLLEGYFTILYGAQARQVLTKYYPWIGLGLAVRIKFSLAGFIECKAIALRKQPDPGISWQELGTRPGSFSSSSIEIRDRKIRAAARSRTPCSSSRSRIRMKTSAVANASLPARWRWMIGIEKWSETVSSR